MVLGFGHHSQRDPNVKGEERGRDPFIATGRGGAGNVSRRASPSSSQQPREFDRIAQCIRLDMPSIRTLGRCPTRARCEMTTAKMKAAVD
jgi:hypothetical protein